MSKESRDVISKEMGCEPIMINASLVSAQSRKRLFWTNIPVVGLPEDRKIFLKDILESKIELEGSSNKPVKLGYVGKGGSNNQGGQALRVYSSEGKSVTLGSSGAGLIKVGHIGNSDSQGNRIYSTEGKSATLSANGGGLGAKTGLYLCGREVGRHLNAEGKREDKPHVPITRRIETRNDDKSGTLTSVTKDNLVVGEGVIRKLTPVECERLQSLPDNYTEGISTTQRYKCLGNAFNVEVIKFILSFIENESTSSRSI
jgi:DNA (cytosine-5)-methyltransferase 3A